jgi:hypothetical protein
MFAAPAAAQEPQQQPLAPAAAQTEHEQLEEEFIRSRIENGESHASGARPELGPVVLGNPTMAVVALRVGLHATMFTPTGGDTGVNIGSYPIDIGRDPGTGPPTLRQQFVAPNAQGVLEIRATNLRGLRVHLNELYDLSFDEATLASGVVRVDVSPYLVVGVNVIQYNPVGRSGEATVNVIVQ